MGTICLDASPNFCASIGPRTLLVRKYVATIETMGTTTLSAFFPSPGPAGSILSATGAAGADLGGGLTVRFAVAAGFAAGIGFGASGRGIAGGRSMLVPHFLQNLPPALSSVPQARQNLFFSCCGAAAPEAARGDGVGGGAHLEADSSAVGADLPVDAGGNDGAACDDAGL